MQLFLWVEAQKLTNEQNDNHYVTPKTPDSSVECVIEALVHVSSKFPLANKRKPSLFPVRCSMPESAMFIDLDTICVVHRLKNIKA